MTALLRKDFTCLFVKSPYLCKSRVSFSASLFHFYSTSPEKKPVINHTVYDFLLHKHHFSPEAAEKAASVLTCLRNPEKSDSILSFFKENGFSNAHLERIVKYKPSFITANLEKSIKPKIKIFKDLGFSDNDIADMIASNASILYRSVNKRVLPALSVLRGLLGSDAEVVRLLTRSGWFMVKDLEKSMVPNIEFFKSRSVRMEQIIRCMHCFPRFLLQKPENVRKYADKAEQMGVKPSSNMYIHAVRVIGSMSKEAWERKLRSFRSLGFSEDDILNAFRKSPPSFAVSAKKMKKVKEILLCSGKYDMACIVAHPTTLMCSIEKRYKPRLQVLASLECKNLIEKWPSVTTLISIPDEVFFKRFGSPYMDEVGNLFVPKSATSGKRKVKLLSST